MTNFREIARDLVARGAAREVRDAPEMIHSTLELLREPEQRAVMAQAAGAWRRDNGGALARTLAVLREELQKTGRWDRR